jgi:hypothetical protein
MDHNYFITSRLPDFSWVKIFLTSTKHVLDMVNDHNGGKSTRLQEFKGFAAAVLHVDAHAPAWVPAKFQKSSENIQRINQPTTGLMIDG